VNLTDEIASRDGRYIQARDRARSATGDDQRNAMNSMADLLQGSAIGKIVQDRQALMALVGILGNRQSMQGIRGQLGSAGGTGDAAFALMAESPSYKAELLAAEKANAMQTALDSINPSLGTMAEQTAALIQQFPNLSAAVLATTTALTALAAAAGVAAGVGLLTKAGGLGRAAGAGAAAAGTAGRLRTLAALAGGMPLAAWGGSAATFATAAGGVAGAGLLGYGAGTLINEGLNWGASKMAGEDTSLGSLLYDFLNHAKEPVKVEVTVVDGNIVAAVNEKYIREARRQ
jgi:hypothetical protein